MLSHAEMYRSLSWPDIAVVPAGTISILFGVHGMSRTLQKLKSQMDRLSVEERMELTKYLNSLAMQKDKRKTASAKKRLAQITPRNAKLRKLARQFPPPAEWFEGEEPQLF